MLFAGDRISEVCLIDPWSGGDLLRLGAGKAKISESSLRPILLRFRRSVVNWLAPRQWRIHGPRLVWSPIPTSDTFAQPNHEGHRETHCQPAEPPARAERVARAMSTRHPQKGPSSQTADQA